MTRTTKILLIHPERIGQRVFDRMPPLGMAWIAAVLRQEGHDVLFIDEQVDDRDAGETAREFRPSLVLIGGTSHSRFDAFARARSIKETNPDVLVVYGGPHASFTARDTLAGVPYVDVVVRGEGEHTALELARWKTAGGRCEELSSISGIAYRRDGGVVSTAPRPFNTNLDLLPLPARDLLPVSRYRMRLEYLEKPAMHLITARGCPFACSFCSASRMYGRSYAMRSPRLVADEIEQLAGRYEVRGLKIFDSTFTINRNHVEAFCRELEERGMVMPWECEVRVGTVNRRLLERMQRAGCYYIDIGIESGDQAVLDGMSKGIDLHEAERLLTWCEELGIRTKAFFTLGHIGETVEAAERTLAFIRKHRKRITLIGYNPGIRIYPGTRVEEHARVNGLLPEGFDWAKPYASREYLRIYRPVDNVPLLLQPGMTIEDLRRLRRRYILSRLLSPRFWFFKLRLLLRHGELGKYLSIGIRGLAGRTSRSS